MRVQLAARLLQIRFVVVRPTSPPTSFHQQFICVWLHLVLYLKYYLLVKAHEKLWSSW